MDIKDFIKESLLQIVDGITLFRDSQIVNGCDNNLG